jgi:tetratricopeptide (TPR) repeat protein
VKRALRALRVASFWASLLSTGTRAAFADDSPTQKVQSAKTAASPQPPSGGVVAGAPANPSSEELAAAAYESALASYAKGDVYLALSTMRESYRLSQKSELLFNLAQLEDELNACSDALADYTRYLELAPNGNYRGPAAEAQQRLERICPPPARVATSTSTADPPPPKPSEEPIGEAEEPGYWTTPRVIGWSTIAAGTITGAVALYFQLEAIQARDEFQQSVDEAVAGGSAVDMTLRDRQHRYNDMAIGFGIAGGAMVAGGAIILLIDPDKPVQRTHSANLYAVPGLVGASFTQRF